MKRILILMLAISLISLSSAATLGTFQQDTCVNLLQNCDNCSYVNVSYVQYPNSSRVIIGWNMQKNVTFYNYTYCDNDAIGTYIYNTCGDDDGFLTCANVDYEITTTGEQVSLSNSIIVVVFLLLAGLFLALGYSFAREHWLLKTFFNFCAIGMGILAINSAKIIASESSNLGKMGTAGLVVGVVIFALFFLYIFVYSFIEIIKALKEKRGVRWNYDR